MAGSVLENIWVSCKNNNKMYTCNKIFSALIASTLATVTIMLSASLKPGDDPCPGVHMRVTYWLLFVFYAFQALDEIMELYSALGEKEKGALGLIFEFNYFIGLGLAAYITYIVFAYPQCGAADNPFNEFYLWLYIQFLILAVAAVVMLFVFCCICYLNKRVTLEDDD